MALQTTTRTLSVVLGMLGRLAAFTYRVTKQSWPSGKLWPLLILAVLALGRWWAQTAGTLLVVGISLLVAVCVTGYLSRKLTYPTDWAYTITCLTAATTGLVLVSIVGTPPWLNILSVLGWAGLSLPWWLHGQRTEAPAPPPMVPTNPEVVANWNRYIRDTHGTLAGANISPPVTFDHGNEYVVSVVPGKQHLGTFESNMRNISTALAVPLHKLLLEQHPDHENPRLLRLRHVTESPIEHNVYFTEPVIEDGRIVLGPYADGMGTASWRLFTENSMWGGFVLGDIGSGKALAVTTPIPTPTGWTTMGALSAGDEVFDETGSVCRVMGAFNVQIDRPCYEVHFSDGERIIADEDHLWWTEDRAARAVKWRERRGGAALVRRPRLSVDQCAALKTLAATYREVTIKQISEATGISPCSGFLRDHATDVGAVGRVRNLGPYRQNGQTIVRPTPWAFTYPAQELVERLILDGTRLIGDQRHKQTFGRVRTTREIADSLFVPGGVNHAVPVTKPLSLPKADLLIDPYVLGCWLGDGDAKASMITSADEELVANIASAGWRCVKQGRYRYSILPPVNSDPERFVRRPCVGCGMVFTTKYPHQRSCSRRCRPTRGSGTAPPQDCLSCGLPVSSGGGTRHRQCRSGVSLKGQLTQLGVYRNKHIPGHYLRASEEQRREILAGLLDTDGTVSPRGTVQFDSMNRQLANDVHELALTLGYRATMTTKTATLNGRAIGPTWRVSFTTADRVFRLQRKNAALTARAVNHNPELTKHRYITDVRAVCSRPVRCISVDSPSKLFLAGRNMVPTHNTRMLELLAIVARSVGVVVIYIDGQNGASSPILWEHATWRGGPTEATTILRALTQGKDKRQVYNRVNGLTGFTPTTGFPGLLVIADECHEVVTPDTAHQWANLARELRKVGGALVFASQFSGLETFGGSDVLRSCLIAGNAVALRTSSRLSAQLIPGLEVDPALFPKLPGYGYYVDASGKLRTAPFRCEWLPDADDKGRNPDIPVPTVEEWFDQLPEPELDDMTAAAFGEPFLNRHELAAERDAQDRAWLEGREEPTPETAPPAPSVQAVPTFTEPTEDDGTASAIEALFASAEQMTLKDIIDGLSSSGRYPTVFTVRSALNHLIESQRITRAGDTYRRGEAA